MDTPDLANLLETHKTELSAEVAIDIRKFRGFTDPTVGPQSNDFIDGVEALVSYLRAEDVSIIQKFYSDLTIDLMQYENFSIDILQAMNSLFIKHMKLLVEKELAAPEFERTRQSYLRHLDRLLTVGNINVIGTSIKNSHSAQANNEPKKSGF